MPSGPEVFTSAGYATEYGQWLKDLLLASQASHGETPASDSGEIRDLLAAYALLCASSQFDSGSAEALLQRSAALMEGGCREPLIVYLHGDLLHRLKRSREAIPFLGDGLALLEQQNYPALERFFAATSLLRAYRVQPPQENIWPELNGKILQALAEAAADERFFEGRQRYYFQAFWAHWNSHERPEEQDALIAALAEIQGVDPWLRGMTTGVNHIRLAWQARGSGWAKSVSETGRETFRRELELAEKDLTEAYRLHPEFPEAAAQMIRVRMALDGPESEREWFDRAVAAQFDYLPAYDWLLRALLPRWGGSHRALYAFGVECLRTGRFDTRVPSRFPRAVHLISEDLDDRRWDIYQRKDVYPLLQSYFMQTLKAPAQAHRARSEKTHYALVAWAAGAFEDAARLLDELGTDFDRQVAAELDFDEQVVRRDLQAFRGAYGQHIRQGLTVEDRGEVARVLAGYQEALGVPGDDPEANRFIWQKICGLHFTDDADYSLRLARQLHALGLREPILMKYRLYLESGGSVDKDGGFYNGLTALVGRHNLDYVELLVHQFSLDEKRVERLRERLEVLAVDNASAGGAEALAMDRELALLRLLLAQDLSGKKREEIGKLLFPKLQHLPDKRLALDFVLAYLGTGRLEAEKQWNLTYNYFAAIAFERHYDLKTRQEVMSRLREISDPQEFLDRVGAAARLHGSPVLFLEMAALCRLRGALPEARNLENLALDWQQSFYTVMGSTPWASYHTLATLAMVNGYEAQAVQYGQLCIDSKFCITGNLLMAHAQFRLGRLDEAAQLAASVHNGQLRQNGPYCLPGRSLAEYPDLLGAVLEEILGHPGLSDRSRALLAETYGLKN